MTRTKTTPDILAEDLALLRRKREELSDIDFVLRGTIVKHYMPCGKPGCRYHTDPPVLHGPYYDWTRMVRGEDGDGEAGRGGGEGAAVMDRERP